MPGTGCAGSEAVPSQNWLIQLFQGATLATLLPEAASNGEEAA
jgi:hypothetical protein